MGAKEERREAGELRGELCLYLVFTSDLFVGVEDVSEAPEPRVWG